MQTQKLMQDLMQKLMHNLMEQQYPGFLENQSQSSMQQQLPELLVNQGQQQQNPGLQQNQSQQQMNPMQQHLNSMEGCDPTPEQMLAALSMGMPAPEDEDDEDDEACAQAYSQQILEHNIALRQNFEELKQLHLQLTDANLQIQEARVRLQQEKETVEKAMKKEAEKASELKIEKERLQSSINDLKLSQEKENRVLRRERDESVAKAESLQRQVQNLEKEVRTSKVAKDELEVLQKHVQTLEKEVLTSKLAKDELVIRMGKIKAEKEELAKQMGKAKVEKDELVIQMGKIKVEKDELVLQMGKIRAEMEQAMTSTFARDSMVTDLKDSLGHMKENMFAQQDQLKKAEQDWECERNRLIHSIESKEQRQDEQILRFKKEAETRLKEEFEQRLAVLQREKEESERLYREEADLCIKEALMDFRYEEEKERDLRRTLEGEAADLRAMLNAMEQASTDAETRHMKAIKELTKEGMALRKELAECKEKEKENIQALKGLRKENSELLSEIEGLRAQVDDALTKNHQFYTEIGDYRRALDKYDRQAEQLKREIHDLEKCRERDQQDHNHILENAKRNWATEKITIMLKETKLAEERQRALTDKNQSLKRKLKETNKTLATVTADHNQLMIRTREIETQLALAQSNRMMYASHPSDHFMPRSEKVMDRRGSNAAWLRAEMAQLEKRQAHFLFRGEQSRGEQSHGFAEATMASHIPQRCQDSSMPEKEEDERSRDGIASLMKAAEFEDKSEFVLRSALP